MFAKRTLFLAAVMAVALLTFVNAGPAKALLDCDVICSCSKSCGRVCMDGEEVSTCGDWGLCNTSPECPCSCSSYTYGTIGDDTLNGGSGNDCMYGGAGDDTISGNGGHDKIWGEDGADSLYGGSGNDCIYGGPLNDYLNGGSDSDVLNGQGGSGDTCVNGEVVSYCEY